MVGYLDTHNGDSMAIVCQSTRLLIKKKNILQFEGIMTHRAECASSTKTGQRNNCCLLRIRRNQQIISIQ
jgi:hypothetical protein